MRIVTLTLLYLLLAPSAFAAAKVQDIALDNGAHAWLIEDHSLPIVTVKVAFEHSGAAEDALGKEGLASFTGQMLDEGAGDMDSLAYQSALDDHAIRLSAETDEDSLNLTLQTLSEFKGDALRLFTLAVTKPRFDKEAVLRVGASIVSDLGTLEGNPGYVASRKWKELAFAGDPYMHPRRGTPASVAAITQDDLRRFAQEHFACNRRVIAVVGDITADEVRRWLADFSAGADCRPAVFPAAADVTIPAGGAPVVAPLGVPQTVTQAGLQGVKRDDPRYYAVYLLNHILGGSTLTARLGKEIRDKRGLAYYADSYLEVLDHATFIAVTFATRNAQAFAAYQVFADTLADTAKNGVGAGELDEAKRYLTGSFPLQIDNQPALAEYLVMMQHYHLGIDYLDKRNGYIDGVTLQQVNDVAKTLLARAPLAVMAGSPAAAPAAHNP